MSPFVSSPTLHLSIDACELSITMEILEQHVN
jgi:hypothetical protein